MRSVDGPVRSLDQETEKELKGFWFGGNDDDVSTCLG